MQPSQEEANHRGSAVTAGPGSSARRPSLAPQRRRCGGTGMTLRPYAVALRPQGRRMPPRGRSLGLLCWEARPAGRWAVPEDAREGRTPPIGVPKTPTTLPALRTRTPKHPDRDRGERPVVARWACAANAQPQQERLGVEGHRDGPRAAGESWRDPVALLIAARAVCRYGCRTLGEHGAAWTIRKFPSTAQAYQRRSRSWRNRHRPCPRAWRDRMEAGQAGRRYDPRSVSWGRNPDQAAR
jgi:hypothetical protein